jgi:hypothetical protein
MIGPAETGPSARSLPAPFLRNPEPGLFIGYLTNDPKGVERMHPNSLG